MSYGRTLLRRAFGRPEGLLGWLGGLMMARMNRGCATSAIDLLALRPQDSVLEIGFGSGIGIAVASQTARRVAGVDPSDVMLAQARRRNAAAIAAGQVDLRSGTADALPFAGGAFDAVFAINSLQLWADRAAGLAEIYRVLAPGGRLALGFTPNSGQGKDGLIALVTRGGFNDVGIVDCGANFVVLAAKP